MALGLRCNTRLNQSNIKPTCRIKLNILNKSKAIGK